jgi:hypothetical protein
MAGLYVDLALPAVRWRHANPGCRRRHGSCRNDHLHSSVISRRYQRGFQKHVYLFLGIISSDRAP